MPLLAVRPQCRQSTGSLGAGGLAETDPVMEAVRGVAPKALSETVFEVIAKAITENVSAV
jgi:hypothetical protein